MGVKSGDATVGFLRAQGIDTFVEYDSYEKLVLAAKEGKVVTFVADEFPTLYFLYKHDIQTEFNYTEPLYTGQAHRAVAKGNTEMLALVEGGFAQISEAECKAIQEKWFGQSSETLRSVLKYAPVIGVIVAGIAFFMLVWNRSLKKSVLAKTYEIVQAVRKTEQSNRKLNGIIKAIPDLVFITDNSGSILDYLSSATHKDLYEPDENLIGKLYADTVPAEVARKYVEKFALVVATGNMQKIEYKMSIRDTVTGLSNRTFFEKQTKKLSEQKKDKIGIIMCDIDGLKLINDTMGHAAGDRYLFAVGKILSSVIKERGFVSRIGGDEFAIVIEDSSINEMIEFVDRISMELKKINARNEHEIPISISIGYSLSCLDKKDLEVTIIEADDLMYRDKLHHRQSVRSYSIDLLSKMLAERDYLTQGHGDRLQENMKKMTIALDFSPKSINDLLVFAQFHDIGKIGISDAILYKKEPLSDSQWEEMKRHSEIGFRIAESSPDLRHISEWILKHHEWWDGTGYPLGLAGIDIPLECRVLSIFMRNKICHIN